MTNVNVYVTYDHTQGRTKQMEMDNEMLIKSVVITLYLVRYNCLHLQQIHHQTNLHTILIDQWIVNQEDAEMHFLATEAVTQTEKLGGSGLDYKS